MGSADIQSSLWSQAPQDWAERQEIFHTPLWEAMLAATDVGPGKHVLDAGCGAAGACILITQTGAKASAIDASEALIDIARMRVPDGVFQVGDLEDLPYDDGSFDVLIAANSVQYAADPVAALLEFKRVTATGGRIAVGIWGRAENCEFRHLIGAVANAMPEPPKGGGPFALSEPGALEALLEQADLTADGRTEVDCPFNYPNVEDAWIASASGGPFQAAMRAAGQTVIEDAFKHAVQPFTNERGNVRIANTMLCVSATVCPA